MTIKDKLPLVKMSYNLNVTCDTGAFGFIEDLAKSAGEDLVYSLALEGGNLFMCVTAFPSMTKKKFASSEDGMRAIFLIDKDEYGWYQSDMVDKLTKLINDQVYYEEDVTPPEEQLHPQRIVDADNPADIRVMNESIPKYTDTISKVVPNADVKFVPTDLDLD